MSLLFTAANSEYLQVSALPVSAYPFTMACWFYQLDITSNCALMGITDINVNNTGWLGLLEARGGDAGNPIRVVVRESAYEFADTITGFTANKWHHACATFVSSTSRRVFLDGGGNTQNIATANPTGHDTFAIGRLSRPSDTDYMNGRIAEAGIWNVTLTNMEISALVAGVSPTKIRRESLAGYWPLQGLSTVSPDLSGNKISLAQFNTPTLANHPPVVPYSARYWGHGPLVEAAGGPATVGLAIEADTAFGITVLKTAHPGLASELDASLALTARKAYSLGLASEADAALLVSVAKAMAVGLASESDSGLALTPAKLLGVGLASEGDSALALTALKAVLAGLASEADSAFPVVAGGAVSVGLASEADSGLPVSVAKLRSVGLATEADSGLALTAEKAYALLQALEADSAFGATHRRSVSVGLASEVDTALAISVAKALAVGLAIEVDSALAVAVAAVAVAIVLFPPNVVDAPLRRWKVDAERTWEIDAPRRRLKVDDDL